MQGWQQAALLRPAAVTMDTTTKMLAHPVCEKLLHKKKEALHNQIDAHKQSCTINNNNDGCGGMLFKTWWV